MLINNKLNTVSLSVLIDKHIGVLGTVKREAFESKLDLDLQGKITKHTKKNKSK